MSYTGYLISNYATGYDQSVQPWLLPDDAQYELFDGFVYRGVWNKREGYSQYANGQRGGAPYCESRMIHTVIISSNESANGTRTSFTFTVGNTLFPLRRGGFRALDYTGNTQTQIIQDNGIGGTLAGSDGTITSVINYTAVLATPQSINFTTPPASGDVITLQLDIHQGFPVMGVMNFYTQDNGRELIVADTTYVNRYNPTTNRLDDISPSYALTGTKFSFFSWVNYADPANIQRLLFVNFVDGVQQYDGTSITPYPIYTASLVVSSATYGAGDGTVGPYLYSTPTDTGVYPGTVSIVAGGQTVTDDSFGNLVGYGTGKVDYLNGDFVVTFNNTVANMVAITISYTQVNTPITTCLHLFQFKDRLVVIYTLENGIQYGKRIRVSGTGAFGDMFVNAIGSGVIDVPDDTYLSTGDFNRDDLLLFTQLSTWVLKYTNNDVVPFGLDKIDESRGSGAPFGCITYLNRTNAQSPLGFILSDGYEVARSDDKIPEYSYNSIDQQNFSLCFAGSVDRDRDHYLIHPSPGMTTSDRILVSNYEEDNYCIYRIPLSCMGNFIVSENITWNDLTIYSSWDAMSTVYGNWGSFGFTTGAPISIGGGHFGEITQLNDQQTEDYPVNVWGISIIDFQTLQFTTDFQTFQVGDYVVIEAAQGMTEVNNKEFQISSVVSPYIFQVLVPTQNLSTYTSGGVASKCIVFDCKTKKFNPFAESDKKVTCGWLYFYVSTSGTDLTVNSQIMGASQTNPCVLNVPGHGYNTGQQVYVNGVQGMTELNNMYYYITVIDSNNFSLNNVDASGFTAYTLGGYTSIPENATLQIRCISNDTEQSTQVSPYNPSPYQVNLTGDEAEDGIKKWYKLWINQTARFVQFQIINNQAGAIVQIHAMMPGFAGVGRLI